MEENPEESEKPDGNVFIVPTSHASKESYNKVFEVSDKVDPDLIAVELDESRLENLKQTKGEIQDASVLEVLEKTKGSGLKGRFMIVLFGLLQSKVASKIGSNLLGIDMLAGYEVSQERDIPLALVDRDINETIERFSDQVTVTELLKIGFYFVLAYVQLARSSSEDFEDINPQDEELSDGIRILEETFPSFKRVFVDERNEYMVKGLETIATKHDRTVLVIGAMHEEGIRELIESSENLTLREVEDINEKELEEDYN